MLLMNYPAVIAEYWQFSIHDLCHGRVQLASDLLSKNFPLGGCPVNPNEAENFSA